MSESAAVNDQAGSGRGRQRRGAARSAFPRVSIQKVIPLLDAIWSEGHGEQVRTTSAFARLGRSHTSGTSRTLIAAANSGYGLISGNAHSTFLGPTENGRLLAGATSDEDRNSTITDAMFSNDIFRTVHGRYLDKALPSDQVVCDFIMSEAGLSEEDASACWSVISENLRYAGLLIKEGGRDVVVARQNAAPGSRSAPELPSPQTDIKNGRMNSGTPVMTTDDEVQSVTQAEFHFNVQIHLPSDATPETYEAIFSSIAKNLLQRKS